jgi:hypothetical protein
LANIRLGLELFDEQKEASNQKKGKIRALALKTLTPGFFNGN